MRSSYVAPVSLLLAFGLLIGSGNRGWCASDDTSNPVVAVVGGQQITQSDLQKKSGTVPRREGLRFRLPTCNFLAACDLPMSRHPERECTIQRRAGLGYQSGDEVAVANGAARR